MKFWVRWRRIGRLHLSIRVRSIPVVNSGFVLVWAARFTDG